jgi:hypothetical protein
LAKVIASNMSPTTFRPSLFILSNKAPKGSRGDFLDRPAGFRRGDSALPASLQQRRLPRVHGQVSEAGYPSLHHSEIYHKLYEPHYLLLAHNLAALLPYFIEIDTLTLNHEDVASYIKTLPYQIASPNL